MQFDTHARFDALPDEVFEIMSDPDFQQEKVERYSEGGTASVRERSDGTVIDTTRSYSTATLPDFVRRFVGEHLVIVEEQIWGPAASDGSRDGTLNLHVSGQPITVKAHASLRPDGSGTVTEIHGTLTARIPFIGGKVESSAMPVVRAGSDAETELIEEWLTR